MIRDYSKEDTDEVVAIWREATQVAHSFFPDDFTEQEARNLSNIYLVHAQTRVVVLDGRVVGFIAMIGDEIGGLFLDPNLHGKGLGRKMVDDAVEAHGALEVEVFERNAVGRRFYDRFGFYQIGSYIHEATGETILRLAFAARDPEAAA